MLIGPPPLASIYPTVLFAGSGDKRDFFLTYFCCPIASTLLINEKKVFPLLHYLIFEMMYTVV